MRSSYFILFGFLFYFFGDSINGVELRPKEYNKTWIYFSNGNDLPEEVHLTQPPPIHMNDVNVMDVMHFKFYTPNNTGSPLVFPMNFLQYEIKRETILKLTSFDKDLQTKIIIHGWNANTQSDMIQAVKDAYVQNGDYNIIAVNWEHLASDIYYLRSAGQTNMIGRFVANIINYLVEDLEQNPNLIHLIGHSLGAHISGFAGSHARYGVERITGLDPARPGFEGVVDPEYRLDPTDAKFVDVIHSCAGLLGFQDVVGHVDFYPNGGNAPQPGCNGFLDLFTACSHRRANLYFAESINSKIGFYAYKCKSWESFKNNECNNEKSILMGDKVPLNARGAYYLSTNSRPNFAMGK